MVQVKSVQTKIKLLALTCTRKLMCFFVMPAYLVLLCILLFSIMIENSVIVLFLFLLYQKIFNIPGMGSFTTIYNNIP